MQVIACMGAFYLANQTIYRPVVPLVVADPLELLDPLVPLVLGKVRFRDPAVLPTPSPVAPLVVAVPTAGPVTRGAFTPL